MPDEMNDRWRGDPINCFFKAIDYKNAIVDGTTSIDDVLFIDTSII